MAGETHTIVRDKARMPFFVIALRPSRGCGILPDFEKEPRFSGADTLPLRRRSMGSTRKMPTLRADHIDGHAAPKRMHQREKIDDDATVGTRARKSLTQPPLEAKRQRKSPRSGARSR